MTSDHQSLRFGIHRMTSRDLAAVAEIERTHQLEPWSASAFLEELSKLHALCFVVRVLPGEGPCPRGDEAQAEALVAGYICSWIVVDEIQVLNLAVHRTFWRRGLGRALLEHVVHEGLSRGCSRATLEVRPSNAEALGLYESMGFRRVGERPGFYAEGGEAAIIMVLDLELNGNIL
ncbi:MAG: ribosomal protein S18-alanine N-acetyltransferase [Syntrophobacteraceae bacterium]|jgi:ribosomal-protein-alanine N-acetyltransferase|nr:ribosomal protein S18-alanine N-acetyltransferase [Syntrophobacteraceae bacterium]